jgi:2-polyprenyl-6-methoxyphenol hydroxylase-like FAD-dependent oxidoreductase
MHDALIAGAGPTGLFLALQLAKKGRGVRLVEANAKPSGLSRAIAILPRSMEAFRIAGIAAPFEAAAHRVTSLCVYSGGQIVGKVPMDAKRSWYDYVAIVPQNLTEDILREALLAAGGTVEYETRLVALVDGPEEVVVRLQSPRGDERVSARYVVGCDGAHSTVRDLIGFGSEGGSYSESFAIADVDTVGDVPPDEITICTHAAGLLEIFPMTTKRRRVIASVAGAPASEVTLDAVNELIGERGPWNIGATKLHSGSRYHIEHRLTHGMQKGRIFLAGDASHVHSPFAGQGLNTGLQDALNLAWKLDYSLAGFATSGLLASYSPERHAVAKDVIRATDLGTRLMTTKNAFARAVRDWAMPNVLESARFQRLFLSHFTGLGTHYARSPIVAGSGLRAADELVRSGDRERRLYDVLDGRHLLVYPAVCPLGVAESFANFAQHYGGAVVPISSESAGLPLVRLVRPDGYVALETAIGDDPTPSIEKLAGVLETHVRRVGRNTG